MVLLERRTQRDADVTPSELDRVVERLDPLVNQMVSSDSAPDIGELLEQIELLLARKD